MKYRLNLLTGLFIAIICLLPSCYSEGSTSVSDNITIKTSANNQSSTDLKDDTEFKLIGLSQKLINDYTSDDFRFLLNTDRTSFIKTFNLTLDNGENSASSPDGWLRLFGSTASDYIIFNIPIKQISLNIMPPESFLSEEYLKPTTDKPYALVIILYNEDALFGKIKYGMTVDQASNEFIDSNVVPFGEEPREQGFFVHYEYDGLLYKLCFPEYNKYKLSEVYISGL